MTRYEDLILEALEGETPKQKHESLIRLKTNMKQTETFKAEGTVLGFLWDNSKGTMYAVSLEADTMDLLKEKAENLLAKNKLTGTGDFESQIGAYLQVEKITTVIIDSKPFTNKEYTESIFIGNLTEADIAFMEDADNTY